ncbi:UPF0262 family protein [Rhizobium leguminosarum]|uniref:UPF0262 family protein n=1 Tax=Rhizobium leguminosarum TaxID=384 RepID=UPI0024B3953E|nr:UPF0262 family protein [Rhizobium leguminosarum]WHO82643.1 UPF0262 family protein [Rhizobium leguminosarum]
MERNKLLNVRMLSEARHADEAVEAERMVTISDLLAESYFEVVGRNCGPYDLTLATPASKLAIHIASRDGVHLVSHILSFTPFKRIIRDYMTICDLYSQAGSISDARRLEAVDMTRRAIHNEGSELLRSRLASKIVLDLETARKLFTLVTTTQRNRLALQTNAIS